MTWTKGLPGVAVVVLAAACADAPAPPAPAERAAPAASTAPRTPTAVPEGPFPLLGDPRAVKGGRLVIPLGSYPTHFGYYGPDRDDTLATLFTDAFFVSLIGLHPLTYACVPELAASWNVSEDQRTITFHLDPDARWSDGKPITSADVAATVELIRHPAVGEVVLKAELDRRFPGSPRVVDDRTIRFEAADSSWRNLLFFVDLPIQPAHASTPETYTEAWREAPPVVSGAYALGPHETGTSLALVRRKDFWGLKKRQFAGLYNFDEIRMVPPPPGNVALEALKKGDTDFMVVTGARRWVEECSFPAVTQGLVKKVRLRHRMPQPPSQMAFNLTDPLFADVRVRRALFHLLPREELHEEMFLGQFRSKDSYFAGSIYANDNEPCRFDPQKARALLAEAGWTRRGPDGVLVQDGRRFELDFIYIHQGAEPVYTVIQEAYRKHGIRMNLRLVAPSAWIKVLEDRAFQMVYATWSTGPFPELRDLWHSDRAGVKGTSNITGFRNEEVDRLIDAYEREPDLSRRVDVVRRVDAILWEQVPYMLDWYPEVVPMLWWDRFGMPGGVSYATQDPRDVIWKLWWYDEARAAALERARRDGGSLPLLPPEMDGWGLHP